MTHEEFTVSSFCEFQCKLKPRIIFFKFLVTVLLPFQLKGKLQTNKNVHEENDSAANVNQTSSLKNLYSQRDSLTCSYGHFFR